jgi:uncharacterized membrane protein YfcA
MPYHRSMNGDGLGADPILTPIIDALIPEIKRASLAAAAASEPMIRRVIQKDVIPYIVVAIALGAALSAAIGAWFATRRR